jgi:hypothetical protein
MKKSSKPMWFENKYPTKCKNCGRHIYGNLDFGDPILWTPGQKGVLCFECGNKVQPMLDPSNWERYSYNN